MFARRIGRAGSVALLAALVASCRQQAAPASPPLPPPGPVVDSAAPGVFDAISNEDHAWAYVDGAAFRTTLLPDLLRAAGSLRADIEVELATLSSTCGFQPLLTIDQLFARAGWSARDGALSWGAVFRTPYPFDTANRCLRALGVAEVPFEGRPGWQIRRAVGVWDDGVFVVGSSALEVHALVERLGRRDPSASAARATLAGAALVANVAQPNPFGVDAFSARWVIDPSRSHLDMHSRFTGETGARQAETIVRDGLLALIGPNPALDPVSQSRAEAFAQGANVLRDGAKLDVALDTSALAGQPAVVSKLANIVVRGVRLYAAWDSASEARDRVFTIARSLVDYANARRGRGLPARFPPSAPLVPERIPEGKRVIPNPVAFSYPSWQDIHYTVTEPTAYSVEFLTAKDGKSAVVRARGDIDGDGITSLFELDVRLDARGVAVAAPVIRERDPDE